MEQTEVRAAAPSEDHFPEMPGIVRVEIEAGIPAEEPSGEEVDREREAIHLREERDDECGERPECPPIARRCGRREAEREDEEDGDVGDRDPPEAVGGNGVTHGDGGNRKVPSVRYPRRRHGLHARRVRTGGGADRRGRAGRGGTRRSAPGAR